MFAARLPPKAEEKVRAICAKQEVSQAQFLMALLLRQGIIEEDDLVVERVVVRRTEVCLSILD